MKKGLFLAIIMMVLLPNVIYARNFTKSEGINNGNKFVKKYTTKDNYLVKDSIIKYVYDGSLLSPDSSYKEAGFLNRAEYIIAGSELSYLYTGSLFWLLTSYNSSESYIVNLVNEVDHISTSSTSGTRPTSFIRNGVTVEGQGSYSNPWYFVSHDEDAPTLIFNSQQNTTYAKSQSSVVTVTDTGNDATGLGANLVVKYGWSTNKVIEPSSYTTVELKNASGDMSANFTASSTNTLTGKYYLWVVPVNGLCDVAGNCNNETYITEGMFYFDNTAPKIDSLAITMSFNSATVSATVTEDHSGVATYYYGSTTGDCSSFTGYASLNSTSKSYNTTLSNLSTTKYNYCLKVADKLGNTSVFSSKSYKSFVKTLGYNYGNYHTWVVPESATYRLEAWGAGTSGSGGGYTSGNIYLTAGTKLFVYVGQTIQGCYVGYTGGCAGTYSAWNGGSMGSWVSDSWSSMSVRWNSGSGATDYRLSEGSWNNVTSLRSRIMVAGGGGGAGTPAGGLTGYSVSNYTQGVDGGGATQTSGGSGYTSTQWGGFGYGGTGGGQINWTANCTDAYGGGGGYYGGGAGYSVAACCPSYCPGNTYGNGTASSAFGAGGSSFISGHSGCNAINASGAHTGSSIHYSGYVFSNTLMIDGYGYRWDGYSKTRQGMPSKTSYTAVYGTDEGSTDDGFARISLISY